MKTQQEIRARFDEVRDGGADVFGFRQEALVQCMEFDTARDLLREGVTVADWHEVDPEREAREYLAFAVGKAVDHRGLSAGRSIEKLTELLWVLDEAELAAEFETTDHYPYGAPQLAVLVDVWLVDHGHKDDPRWLRMRDGRPCSDDCVGGC